MTDRRRAKGEGTIRLRSDGRYEGREPLEIVPPVRNPAASTERASGKWRRRSARLVASGSKV